MSIESMGSRKIANQLSAYVPFPYVHDWFKSVNLHNHVHCVIRYESIQGRMESQ